MQLSTLEFARLVRIIRKQHRPQAIFVGRAGIIRVATNCKRFDKLMEERHEEYVGTYNKHTKAGWLEDDLRDAGVRLTEDGVTP